MATDCNAVTPAQESVFKKHEPTGSCFLFDNAIAAPPYSDPTLASALRVQTILDNCLRYEG